jgi:hypothetical protein
MIDDLKMTFGDIMEMDYRLLVMMQADKPRADYSDTEEVENVSGKDMLKRKRK